MSVEMWLPFTDVWDHVGNQIRRLERPNDPQPWTGGNSWLDATPGASAVRGLRKTGGIAIKGEP